tara:strand:+ start:101 stop:529 length:429 start_codon:yes stop_codon:yes gene_type:complete
MVMGRVYIRPDKPSRFKNNTKVLFVNLHLIIIIHKPLTYSDVPGAPNKPDVTKCDASFITISWYPPDNDGGSPVISYIIEKHDTLSTKWVKVARDITEMEYTIENLIEGKEYAFRVAAVNKAGEGPFSMPSEPKKCRPQYGM